MLHSLLSHVPMTSSLISCHVVGAHNGASCHAKPVHDLESNLVVTTPHGFFLQACLCHFLYIVLPYPGLGKRVASSPRR